MSWTRSQKQERKEGEGKGNRRKGSRGSAYTDWRSKVTCPGAAALAGREPQSKYTEETNHTGAKMAAGRLGEAGPHPQERPQVLLRIRDTASSEQKTCLSLVG